MVSLLSWAYELAVRLLKSRAFRTATGRRILLPLGQLALRFIYPMLPNPMQIQGLILHWKSTEGDLYPIALLRGTYEPGTTQVFQRLLRPGMIVVDLGAHIGYYSLLAARTIGRDGIIYAFEPEPSNFAILKKNIEVNAYEGTIIPVPKAVSSNPGTLELFIADRDSRGASIYHTRHSGKRSVKAHTVNLDSFFSEIGWPAVDLIKMDIEGAEKEALEGMKELSRRSPKLKLITEFAPENLLAAKTTPAEFFHACRALDFNKISIICDSSGNLEPLDIPKDIPYLLSKCGNGNVDLLCEK